MSAYEKVYYDFVVVIHEWKQLVPNCIMMFVSSITSLCACRKNV